MTNHKKHLISLRIPANSYKPAPETTLTRETVPIVSISKLKSFLRTGFTWTRKKKERESGATTSPTGHRYKGSFFSEKMRSQQEDFSEKTEPFPEAAQKQPRPNFQIFWTGLKEHFYRFMETVFLLDSPQELAIALNSNYSALIIIRKTAQPSKNRLFSFLQNEDKPFRPETAGVRLSDRITSIADRYRSFENKPIPVETRQPAFKMVNYRFREAVAGLSPGFS